MNKLIKQIDGQIEPIPTINGQIEPIPTINGTIATLVKAPSYILHPATTESLGGVIIGNNLTVDENGTIAVNVATLSTELTSIIGDKTFIFNQIVATNIWEITHNLEKNPSVVIIDNGGSNVIGEVIYINENTLEIHFLNDCAGTAYLN